MCIRGARRQDDNFLRGDHPERMVVRDHEGSPTILDEFWLAPGFSTMEHTKYAEVGTRDVSINAGHKKTTGFPLIALSSR